MLKDEAVEILKSRLADIEDDDRYKLEIDFYLHQWLKEYDFNLDKTEAAIRKAFKHRKDSNVNSSVAESNFPTDVFNLFPVYLDGKTKYGDTVMTCDCGKWDVKSFVAEHGDGSQIIRYFDLLLIQMENLWLESNGRILKEKGGKFLEKPALTHFVVSMHSWSIKQIMGSKLVDTYLGILKTATTNYVPMFGIVNFINTITLFSVALKIMKSFLSKYVVEVYGYDQEKWEKQLEKQGIEMSTLRPDFGGTRQDEIVLQ